MDTLQKINPLKWSSKRFCPFHKAILSR
jgi:hypothetical protein